MENEKRLIDGLAFLDKVLLHYTECERNRKLMHASCEIKQNIADMVVEAPTVDAVEVVRCGVCRYCDTADCPMSGTPGRVSASDFCSYGERKTK